MIWQIKNEVFWHEELFKKCSWSSTPSSNISFWHFIVIFWPPPLPPSKMAICCLRQKMQDFTLISNLMSDFGNIAYLINLEIFDMLFIFVIFVYVGTSDFLSGGL